MSKRILFVDDELMVLKGLERSLRGMRKEWEMEFVLGGPEALEAMALAPFDVVISDMRMPGMDGAQLLDLVKQRFSRTVRMVLSGQSDKDSVFRAIRPTHQYLSKPCDIEELKQKLKYALDLRDMLSNSQLKQRVSQIECVPSLPSLYRALRAQLESPHASLPDVAGVVCRDPGMTAKLLQLVNSSFLGAAARLSCPQQAVSIVGLDNLRHLVLDAGLFSELPKAMSMLTPLWEHCHSIALFAEAIAHCEHVGETSARDCFTAGLLHEIGWIVLATSYGENFQALCAFDHGLPGSQDEPAAFGGTHGQVGAYLLGLWGLPDCIVQAVAWHHTPAQAQPTIFCPLVAVHVADVFHTQLHAPRHSTGDDLTDTQLLAQLGLLDRLPVWLERCREIEAQNDPNPNAGKEESHA